MRLFLFLMILFSFFSCSTGSDSTVVSNQEKPKSELKTLNKSELIQSIQGKCNSEKFKNYDSIKFRVDFQLFNEEFLKFNVQIKGEEQFIYFDNGESLSFQKDTLFDDVQELSDETKRSLKNWVSAIQFPFHISENIGTIKKSSIVEIFNMNYYQVDIIEMNPNALGINSVTLLVESESYLPKLIWMSQDLFRFNDSTKANAMVFKNYMIYDGVQFPRRISLMTFDGKNENAIGEARIKNIEVYPIEN